MPKIQVRRGTSQEIGNIIPDVGEPYYVTDTKKAGFGDGINAINSDSNGVVSKTGDTITGKLTILCDNDNNGNLVIQNTDVDFVNGVSATRNTYFSFKDVNGVTISEFQNHFTTSQNRMTMRVRPWGDTTTSVSSLPGLFLDANSDGSLVAQFSGMTEFKFPKSYNVDGQWVYSSVTICSSRNAETSDKDWDLSAYLPDDNYNYEVLLVGIGVTGATSGNVNRIYLKSSIITSNTTLAGCVTRTSASNSVYGMSTFPIGADKILTVGGYANNTGTYTLVLQGYRRLGTND